MPLRQFFADQARLLREFADGTAAVARRLVVDPDLKPVAVRMLSGMERDPEVPHAFIPVTPQARNRDGFFKSLLAELTGHYDDHRQELLEAGLLEPFTTADLKRDPPDRKVVLYLSALAEWLPDDGGNLVVLIDTPTVTDPAEYAVALAWLADSTWSPRVRYLVLDDRKDPTAAELVAQTENADEQVFFMPPEEIEKQVRNAVQFDASLSSPDRRQYLGMLAGFAIARKEYAEASAAWRQQLELVKLDGTPADAAPVHYNLGNSLMAAGDLPAAEQEFGTGLDLALTHGPPTLVPLILCHLGEAVDRQGRPEQAEQCFTTAREYARKTAQRPTEAYVNDVQARCRLRAGDADGAEKAWRESLKAYDGITAEGFADVREAGRRDVLIKLEQLYTQTRQPAKLAALRASAGAAV